MKEHFKKLFLMCLVICCCFSIVNAQAVELSEPQGLSEADILKLLQPLQASDGLEIKKANTILDVDGSKKDGSMFETYTDDYLYPNNSYVSKEDPLVKHPIMVCSNGQSEKMSIIAKVTYKHLRTRDINLVSTVRLIDTKDRTVIESITKVFSMDSINNEKTIEYEFNHIPNGFGKYEVEERVAIVKDKLYKKDTKEQLIEQQLLEQRLEQLQDVNLFDLSNENHGYYLEYPLVNKDNLLQTVYIMPAPADTADDIIIYKKDAVTGKEIQDTTQMELELFDKEEKSYPDAISKDKDGRFVIHNSALDLNYYQLEETKAPYGYKESDDVMHLYLGGLNTDTKFEECDAYHKGENGKDSSVRNIYVNTHGDEKIVYCFNRSKAFPAAIGYTNGHKFIKHKTDAEFLYSHMDQKVKPVNMNRCAQYNMIKTIILNGYENAKTMYGKQIDPELFRVLTQHAIWYYTDGGSITPFGDKNLEWNKLFMDFIRANEMYLLDNLNTLNNTRLFLYTPAQRTLSGRQYQNLLSVEIQNTHAITLYNQPIAPVYEVKIHKVEKGKLDVELEGATLKLYHLEKSSKDPISTWVSKDVPHTINLSEGSYALVEAQAPDGYLIEDILYFKVDKDGKISIKKDDGTYEEQSSNDVTLENVPEEKPTYKVYFSKTSEGETVELTGAILEVYELDGETQKKLDHWESTTEKHQLSLPKGHYKMVERKAPNGYKTAKDIHFIIDDEGNLFIKDDPIKKEDRTVHMVDKKESEEPKDPEEPEKPKYNVTIRKVALGKHDKELTGATLVVYKLNEEENTKEEVKTWVSEETPLQLGLTSGSYKLGELEAPVGYQQEGNLFFKIDEEGNLSTSKDGTTYKNQDDKVVILENAPEECEKFKVKFSKQELHTGHELKGAHLVVYQIQGHEDIVKDTWVSTDTPHELSLTKGEYRLFEEQAPEGYKEAQSIHFKVDDQGKVLIQKEGNEYVEQKEALVVMKDEIKQHKILFSKTAVNGTKELPGATLVVYTVEDNQKKDMVASWVSSRVEKQLELTIGEYALVETIVPEHYLRAEEIFFKVDGDGKLFIKQKDGSYARQRKNLVHMEDQLEPETPTTPIDPYDPYEPYEPEEPKKPEVKTPVMKTTVSIHGVKANDKTSVTLDSKTKTDVKDDIIYYDFDKHTTYKVQGKLFEVKHGEIVHLVSKSDVVDLTTSPTGQGIFLEAVTFKNVELEEGKQYVIFEYAVKEDDYHGGNVYDHDPKDLIKHEDPNDISQTILVKPKVPSAGDSMSVIMMSAIFMISIIGIFASKYLLVKHE